MKHGRKEHPLPLCGSINFPPRGERRGRRCFEIIPGNFQFRSGFEGRRRATCSEFPLLVRAEGFRSESDQEKFSSFLTRGEGETEEACSKVGSVVWRANLVATWGGRDFSSAKQASSFPSFPRKGGFIGILSSAAASGNSIAARKDRKTFR